MLKFLRSTATLAALVIGIAGATLVLYAWRLPPFTSSIETTDNAYVRGQLTVISPQLAGYVAEVAVQDFQKVTAGQLLVRIDDRIFQQKLEQAKATLAAQKAALANSEQTRRSSEAKIKSSEAQVDSAKAALKAAEANWERIEPLLSRGVTTHKEADQARANLDQAKAALSQAQAAVEVARQDLAATLVNRSSLESAVQGAEAAVHLAEIDLQNTRIVAPRDGRLGEIGARIGQYVSAGTQLLEDRCAGACQPHRAHRAVLAGGRFRVQRPQGRQCHRQLHQGGSTRSRAHRHRSQPGSCGASCPGYVRRGQREHRSAGWPQKRCGDRWCGTPLVRSNSTGSPLCRLTRRNQTCGRIKTMGDPCRK
jgi:biotin carboxyl carrier protein